MSKDKIQLIHPNGKNAPAISRETFAMFEKAIITVLKKHQPLTFTTLAEKVDDYVRSKLPAFEGSCPWYSVCVKLHLEATGIIIARMEKGTKMHYLK